jgi:dihydrofolate reductase
MLIYSMSVSVDGFINDAHGAIDWSPPSDELFEFHLDRVRGLAGHLCGRRLYETMLVWETDPSVRTNQATSAFADTWRALPKVVFSRKLERVEGYARLARASLPDELAGLTAARPGDIEVGGADLAAEAIRLDLIDEYRMFRVPVILGGGTPFFPPRAARLPLELIETRAFDSTVIYERYRRVRR